MWWGFPTMALRWLLHSKGHMSQEGERRETISMSRTRSSTLVYIFLLPVRTGKSSCIPWSSRSASSDASPFPSSSPSLTSSGKLTSHAVGRCARCGFIECDGGQVGRQVGGGRGSVDAVMGNSHLISLSMISLVSAYRGVHVVPLSR